MKQLISTMLIIGSLLFSYADEQNAEDKNNAPHPKWIKVDTGPIAFYAPKEIKDMKARAIDSFAKMYKLPNMDLNFELGIYGGSFEHYKWNKNFKEEKLKIDGKEASIVTYDDPNATFGHVAAVHFPKVSQLGGKTTKLKMWANCKTPDDYKIAKKIFLSITFKKKPEKVSSD